MAEKKSKSASSDSGTRAEARPVTQADNSEQPGTYKENPDKPGPESVAQIQVLPDEK